MCSSSHHSWLDVEQGELFIIGFVEGVVFTAWSCVVEWSCGLLGLLDVVVWSEILAILALYRPSLVFLLYD
jgi:hypothetical protein